MRVRWFSITGSFLLIAVWQSGINTSFEAGMDRFAMPRLELENAVQAESLSTFSIEPAGSFPGSFRSFTPDDEGLVTYEFDGDQTRLFSFDGTELLSFIDTSIWFAPNGQMMVRMSPGSFGSAPEAYTTRLMTLEGTEIASFPEGRATFVPDTELLSIWNEGEGRSRLFNLAGEEIAVLEGEYFGLTLGPRDIVTYSITANRYYLYDLNGVEIASFPGDIEGWEAMPDYQSVLVSEAGQTRWFDRNGVELATYSGHIAETLPDGRAIFLHSQVENISRLVSLDGEEIASYTGLFRTLTPDCQRVVTQSFEDRKTRIYALDGTEIAVMPGAFREFSPHGEGIIVSSYNLQNPDDQNSVLYTLDGIEIATYIGRLEVFWPESEIVITSSSQQLDNGPLLIQTHLYSLDGKALATVEGSFGGISPNQGLLAVSPNDSPRTTELYRVQMGE